MKVLLFYKDFTKVSTQFSHVGLGINALMIKEVLGKHRIDVDIHGVKDASEIEEIIAFSFKKQPPRYVILEAPWVDPKTIERWLTEFPNIHFIVRCHSQIDFLAVEPGAIWQLRKEIELQKKYPNFKLATNSKHLQHWFDTVFNIDSLYLPNLYHRTKPVMPVGPDPDTLHIGSFGALRTGKNHTSSCAVAMIMAKELRKKLRFYVNVNRQEHGPGVLEALKAMTNNVEGVTLVEVPWKPWHDFKHVVADMDLCMQLSHTETFNITSADAVNELVPCLVSAAIEWCPPSWKVVNTDNLGQAAMIGIRLLVDRDNAVSNGIRALDESIALGVEHWKLGLK